jgi:hypothetical protein
VDPQELDDVIAAVVDHASKHLQRKVYKSGQGAGTPPPFKLKRHSTHHPEELVDVVAAVSNHAAKHLLSRVCSLVLTATE